MTVPEVKSLRLLFLPLPLLCPEKCLGEARGIVNYSYDDNAVVRYIQI